MPIIDADFTDTRLSMHHWLPRLNEASVPTPETTFIKPTRTDDGFPFEWDTDEIRETIKSYGDTEAFIRTDMRACKDRLHEASHIKSLDTEQIDHTVMILLDAMMQGGTPFQSLAVREWLPLDTRFTAGIGRKPISTEVRVFIDNGVKCCQHFYWPREAVKPERNDAVEEYEAMLSCTREESDEIDRLVDRVLDEFQDEPWAVDFARAEDGDWYAIDMSLYGAYWNRKDDRWKSLSWHPDCEHNVVANRERYDFPSEPQHVWPPK